MPRQSQKWSVTYWIGFVSNVTDSDCYVYVTDVTICPNILSKSWPKIAVDVHCSNSLTSFSDDLFCIARKVRDSGRRLCIVIVAEGAQDDAGNPVTSYHIREVRRLVITKLSSKLSAIIKLRSNFYQRPPFHNGHLSTKATFFGGQSIHCTLTFV